MRRPADALFTRKLGGGPANRERDLFWPQPPAAPANFSRDQAVVAARKSGFKSGRLTVEAAYVTESDQAANAVPVANRGSGSFRACAGEATPEFGKLPGNTGDSAEKWP